MFRRLLYCLSLIALCCTALTPHTPLQLTPETALAADPAPPQFLRDLPDLAGRISASDTWTIGGGYLYWAQGTGCDVDSGNTGYLRRWPLRGGRVVTLSSQAFCTTRGFAADDTGLYYWANGNIVRRATSTPSTVTTIIASAAPVGPIILNNGTTIWRDYIFWLANNTVYSAHRFTFKQLAAPEPLGANASNLMFANDGSFYWFANGGLYKALKACLGFGGGACSKEVVASESGDHVTDAKQTEAFDGSSVTPLWTSGANLRGIWCRRGSGGFFQTCSASTSYTAPANGTLGGLGTDGNYLFWIENRQDQCAAFCDWGSNGRLMKWNLHQSLFAPNAFDTPQPIACKQCYANYAISGIPTSVAAADGWVYFDTSNGLSRLRADAPAITVNLAADSYEVTQGIQNLNNDVPLVANKPTFVRVYGRQLSGPNAYSVDALLYGTQANGAPLPGSPLRPINGGQDFASGNVDPSRGAAAGGWLFALPDAWASAGTIKLRPLIDPAQVWSDPDPSNNTLAARPFTFTHKAPICIVTIPVRTHAPAANNNDPSLFRMTDMIRQLMPTNDVWMFHQDDDVAQLEARFGIPPWKYEPYAVPEKGSAILRALGLREDLTDDPDQCDDAGAITHYVGLVNAQTPTNTSTGENLGLGNTPGSDLYVKLIDPTILASTTQDWQVQRFETLAHELSHNYGRQHVNCGGAANTDPNFPYAGGSNGPNCVIDDGKRGGAAISAYQRYYGFDTKSQTPIDPSTVQDYMSYGQPFWVSDYTWKALFGAISNTSLVAVQQAQRELDASAKIVYLSGSVDTAHNTGDLDYAWTYPTTALSSALRRKLQQHAAPHFTTTTRAVAAGTYRLRLSDASGAVLDERAVTLETAADGDTTMQNFTLTFPAPAGQVAHIELLSGDAVDRQPSARGERTYPEHHQPGGRRNG